MEKKSYKKPMADSSKLRVQSILAGSSQSAPARPGATEEFEVKDTKQLNWF